MQTAQMAIMRTQCRLMKPPRNPFAKLLDVCLIFIKCPVRGIKTGPMRMDEVLNRSLFTVPAIDSHHTTLRPVIMPLYPDTDIPQGSFRVDICVPGISQTCAADHIRASGVKIISPPHDRISTCRKFYGGSLPLNQCISEIKRAHPTVQRARVVIHAVVHRSRWLR